MSSVAQVQSENFLKMQTKKKHGNPYERTHAKMKNKQKITKEKWVFKKNNTVSRKLILMNIK